MLYPCLQCGKSHSTFVGCSPEGEIVDPHVFEHVPEVNPLAYVVKETCSQCHQATKETVSGICLNCDYVNRVTASKPA